MQADSPTAVNTLSECLGKLSFKISWNMYPALFTPFGSNRSAQFVQKSSRDQSDFYKIAFVTWKLNAMSNFKRFDLKHQIIL
jgi:hypothetical protein